MENSSVRSVWKPVAVSAAIAAVLLTVFVLPAEYGVDPTGIGRALGLTGLADPPPRAFYEQEIPVNADEFTFTLEPYESLEYKYLLGEGAGLVFTWTSDGPLEFDFHSEPEGAEEGFAESFDSGAAASKSGTYVAPFDGEHGWFWENRSASALTVTLKVSGFVAEVKEYRDGFVNQRSIVTE